MTHPYHDLMDLLPLYAQAASVYEALAIASEIEYRSQALLDVAMRNVAADLANRQRPLMLQ